MAARRSLRGTPEQHRGMVVVNRQRARRMLTLARKAQTCKERVTYAVAALQWNKVSFAEDAREDAYRRAEPIERAARALLTACIKKSKS